MKCSYCGKEYSSKIGFANHIRRCPKNPNRVLETLSDAGRERMRLSARQQNAAQWTQEFRDKHSVSMKKAVNEHPESYTASNRGRAKQIEIDGIKLHGQWEVEFYKWAKTQGLNPTRLIIGFRYEWNGGRTYYPDFYIESLDLYVEVKGYETDRDRAKWRDFPKKLIVIKANDIARIRQGIFVGL